MRKLIYLITLTVVTGIQMSCGPAWYLQKAQQKGASVRVDTVFQDVITQSTKTDTVLKFQTVDRILAGDTVTINTVRWRLRERIDTFTRTRYVQVECKPDTMRINTAINTEISAGYTKWQLIGSTLGGILFVGLMAFGAYKLAQLIKRSA